MSQRRLAIILTVAFFAAMFIGPGPGLRLVNPDITADQPAYTVAGIPVIYAWGLFWYVVQLTILLIAYFKLWTDDEAVVTPP